MRFNSCDCSHRDASHTCTGIGFAHQYQPLCCLQCHKKRTSACVGAKDRGPHWQCLHGKTHVSFLAVFRGLTANPVMLASLIRNYAQMDATKRPRPQTCCKRAEQAGDRRVFNFGICSHIIIQPFPAFSLKRLWLRSGGFRSPLLYGFSKSLHSQVANSAVCGPKFLRLLQL